MKKLFCMRFRLRESTSPLRFFWLPNEPLGFNHFEKAILESLNYQSGFPAGSPPHRSDGEGIGGRDGK